MPPGASARTAAHPPFRPDSPRKIQVAQVSLYTRNLGNLDLGNPQPTTGRQDAGLHSVNFPVVHVVPIQENVNKVISVTPPSAPGSHPLPPTKTRMTPPTGDARGCGQSSPRPHHQEGEIRAPMPRVCD